MSHTCTFRIAATVVLGLPTTDGWVPTLLVRVCRECQHTEALFSHESVAQEAKSLAAWEVWGPEGMRAHSPEGKPVRFKVMPERR